MTTAQERVANWTAEYRQKCSELAAEHPEPNEVAVRQMEEWLARRPMPRHLVASANCLMTDVPALTNAQRRRILAKLYFIVARQPTQGQPVNGNTEATTR